MFAILRESQKGRDMSFVKVKAIKKTWRRADVYNLEVPATECFAINGGIIVHNCRYAIERLVSPKAKFYVMGFQED